MSQIISPVFIWQKPVSVGIDLGERMDDSKVSGLEKFWWMFFGTIVMILMGPGIIFDWIGDKLTGNTDHKGAGALGLAIIVSIIFWTIAIAVGVGFLLPW